MRHALALCVVLLFSTLVVQATGIQAAIARLQSPWSRNEALTQLYALGPAVVAPMRMLLQDDNPRVRADAFLLLRQHAALTETQLLACLRDPALAREALQELRERPVKVVPTLTVIRAALASDYQEVRETAPWLLTKANAADCLPALLGDADPVIRRRVYEHLLSSAPIDQVVSGLIIDQMEHDLDQDVREQAHAFVLRHGRRLRVADIQPLLRLWPAAHPYFRYSLMAAINRSSDPASGDVIYGFLTSPDAGIREGAFYEGIGCLDEPRVLACYQTAVTGADVRLRKAAFSGLTRIASSTAADLIYAQLTTSSDAPALDTSFRSLLVFALARDRKDPRMAPWLLELAGDNYAIDDALRAIASAHPADIMRIAQTDRNPANRLLCLKALEDEATDKRVAFLVGTQGRMRAARALPSHLRPPAAMLSLCARLAHDADSAVRRRAVSWLATSGDPAAVEPLLNALRDREAAIRTAACYGLACWPGPRVDAALCQAARQGQGAALIALANHPDDAQGTITNTLLAALDHAGTLPQVSLPALWYDNDARDAVDPLCTALTLRGKALAPSVARRLASPRPTTRAAAVQALATLGVLTDDQASQALADRDLHVRDVAFDVLPRLTPHIRRQLESMATDPAFGRHAADALAGFGVSPLPSVVPVLRHPNLKLRRRALEIVAFYTIDPAYSNCYRGFLYDGAPDLARRRQMIEAGAKLHLPSAVAALLQDPDPAMRRLAADTLYWMVPMHDDRMAPWLLVRWRVAKTVDERREILRAFRQFGVNDEAAALLRGLLREPQTPANAAEQALAVVALGQGRRLDALEDILRLLRPIAPVPSVEWRHSYTPDLPQAAAVAAGKLGVKALPLLRAKLAGTSDVDREAAARAVGMLRDPACLPDLVTLASDPSPTLRAVAAWGLGRLHDARTVPALCELVGDHDALVQLRALEALRWTGDPAAVPALIRCLPQADDHGREHRRQLARALLAISGPQTVDQLIEAIPTAGAAHQQVLFGILRLLTGQPLTTAEDWTAWWARQHDRRLPLPSEYLPDEDLDRAYRG